MQGSGQPGPALRLRFVQAVDKNGHTGCAVRAATGMISIINSASPALRRFLDILQPPGYTIFIITIMKPCRARDIMAKKQAYGNESNTTLKGAERVRKRPAVIFVR